MKTIAKFAAVTLAFILLVGINPQAFADGKKYETATIKAKVDCNGCKTKIEHHIAFEKGVKDVTADVETKLVTITYDPQKTTPQHLCDEITKLGYEGKVVKGECKDGKAECKDGKAECTDSKTAKTDCTSTCDDKKGEAKSKCESSCTGKSKDPNCCDKK